MITAKSSMTLSATVFAALAAGTAMVTGGTRVTRHNRLRLPQPPRLLLLSSHNPIY